MSGESFAASVLREARRCADVLQRRHPDPAVRAGVDLAREASRVITLGFEIADDAARSEIEVYAPERIISGRRWYDVSPAALAATDDPLFVEDIPRSVEYLGLRGLLLRHPDNTYLVGFAPP